MSNRFRLDPMLIARLHDRLGQQEENSGSNSMWDKVFWLPDYIGRQVQSGWTRLQSEKKRLGTFVWPFGIVALFLWFTSVVAVFFDADVASSLATSAAVPAALATILQAIHQSYQSAQENRSRFYLDAFREGIAEAHKLLEDGNQDRVTWITAARILSHCRGFEKGIFLEEHKNILEVIKNQYRRKFSYVLGFDNPMISSSFFYGAPSRMPLDQAAISGRAKGKLVYLDESSVKVVWSFAKFPKNYPDILEVQRFTEDDICRMYWIFPDLCEWVIHTCEWTVVGGKLMKLKKPVINVDAFCPEARSRIRESRNRNIYSRRDTNEPVRFKITLPRKTLRRENGS